MKRIVFIIILVLNIPLTTYSNTNHPIKLTSSEIKYIPKTKNIRIECKVFIDDFAPVISSTLLKSIAQKNLTQEDLSKIENYFLEKFKIIYNGKPLPWNIDSYHIEHNILTLVYCNYNIDLNKDDHLKIENEMLFEVFGEVQSNWMTISFPPYFNDHNFESKLDDPIYSNTL